MKSSNTRTDVYQIVTDRIISQLESGIIPWEKPWTGTSAGAVSGSTGKPYSLTNQILLGKPGKWYTFQQAKALGGSVRKGEKSSICVFWKQVKITVTNDDGTEEEKLVPMLRYFNVFHASQVDGLPESPEDEPPAFTVSPDETADQIISQYCFLSGVSLENSRSDQAYYSPSTDAIHLPLMEQFPVTAEYYSTAFHEMTHSTGHKSRLDRLTKNAAFGSEDYSKEELVAEIGSAMLMNYSGVEIAKTSRNSAAYIQGWLKALRDDKKLLISAAARAEKAVDYILDLIPNA